MRSLVTPLIVWTGVIDNRDYRLVIKGTAPHFSFRIETAQKDAMGDMAWIGIEGTNTVAVLHLAIIDLYKAGE